MDIEKIDVVIDKDGCMPPDDEDDEMLTNDPDISDVIESSGMRRPNRDLDVMTEWEMFPAQKSYEDDDGGESDVMIGQCP